MSIPPASSRFSLAHLHQHFTLLLPFPPAHTLQPTTWKYPRGHDDSSGKGRCSSSPRPGRSLGCSLRQPDLTSQAARALHLLQPFSFALPALARTRRFSPGACQNCEICPWGGPEFAFLSKERKPSLSVTGRSRRRFWEGFSGREFSTMGNTQTVMSDEVGLTASCSLDLSAGRG